MERAGPGLGHRRGERPPQPLLVLTLQVLLPWVSLWPRGALSICSVDQAYLLDQVLGLIGTEHPGVLEKLGQGSSGTRARGQRPFQYHCSFCPAAAPLCDRPY